MKKPKISFTVPGGHIPTKIENIGDHLNEQKRGCGRHKSARDYRRTPKHKGGENNGY